MGASPRGQWMGASALGFLFLFGDQLLGTVVSLEPSEAVTILSREGQSPPCRPVEPSTGSGSASLAHRCIL